MAKKRKNVILELVHIVATGQYYWQKPSKETSQLFPNVVEASIALGDFAIGWQNRNAKQPQVSNRACS